MLRYNILGVNIPANGQKTENRIQMAISKGEDRKVVKSFESSKLSAKFSYAIEESKLYLSNISS